MTIQDRAIAKLCADTLATYSKIIEDMQTHLINTMQAGFGLDKCTYEMKKAADKLRRLSEKV